MGRWVTQAGRFESECRFAAEPGLVLILILAFDVDEPWRCRGAQCQAEVGAKVSERSEFFAPRLIRAQQDIPRSGTLTRAEGFLLTF